MKLELLRLNFVSALLIATFLWLPAIKASDNSIVFDSASLTTNPNQNNSISKSDATESIDAKASIKKIQKLSNLIRKDSMLMASELRAPAVVQGRSANIIGTAIVVPPAPLPTGLLEIPYAVPQFSKVTFIANDIDEMDAQIAKEESKLELTPRAEPSLVTAWEIVKERTGQIGIDAKDLLGYLSRTKRGGFNDVAAKTVSIYDESNELNHYSKNLLHGVSEQKAQLAATPGKHNM